MKQVAVKAISPAPTAEQAAGLTASQALDVLSTIGSLLLAIATLGFAAFRFLKILPTGASHNPDRTFFLAVNALTQTGFEQANAASVDFPVTGKIALCLLAASGALVSLVGGGWLLSRAAGGRTTVRTLVGVALAIICLSAALCGPIVGWADAFLNASGVGLSTTGPSTLPGDLLRQLSAMPGAIGVLTVMLIAGAKSVRDPRGYLALSFALFVVLVMIGIAANALAGEGGLAGSLIASTDYRGLGLNGPKLDGTVSLWTAILLMLPGGGPASTSGGLGTLPLVIVAMGVIDVLRGRAADRWLGVAIAWIAAFFGTMVALVLGLAALEPALTGERLLLLAVSAVTNNGLSVNPVGFTGSGLFVLSFGMIVGRLLPLTMLGWLAVTAVPIDRRDAVRA